MKVVFDERARAHDPKFFLVNGAVAPCPEVPARVDRLIEGVSLGSHQLVKPEECGLGPVAAVHSPEYLRFLATAAERWARTGGGAEAVPNVHPVHKDGMADSGYPQSMVGQLGAHTYDTAAPVMAETWTGALASAATAVHAADLVLGGARAAYALCRPPGHHASADMMGGFCYLNNSAIAAQRLRGHHDRVAILDVDVHHGNGTQHIFYGRADVLTVSLHADPARFYPFFWGYASERGAGDGLGRNLNIPLPRGTGDEDYLQALDGAIERIVHFAPGALVVALGLDAHESDPFKGLAITTGGFARIAARIAALGLPTVLVQEGGYLSDDLARNIASFLDGFEAGKTG
jgi:acetoin utilization deacetylase AcuC-like enzyme